MSPDDASGTEAPRWIHTEQVLRIHELQIERHGGLEGLRDFGLLESAVARPRNHFEHGERSEFVLAAIYAHALASNHPFVDGNKRVAHATADLFLYLRGHDLEVGDVDEHAAFFEGVAAGKATVEQIAEFLRIKSTRR